MGVLRPGRARGPERGRRGLDVDVVEAEPAGQPAQLGGELGGRLLGRTRLGVGRLHPQHAGPAVGLEVDPGDEPVAEQERQHVVAVHCRFGLGDVDLDAVVEVEELLGAGRAPTPPGRTG